MIGWGVTILIIGIGSFLLPMMGMQFRIMAIFGEGNEQMGGVILAVIGVILIVIGALKGRKSGEEPPKT